MKYLSREVLFSFTALILGFAAALLISALMGESPIKVAEILFNGSLGSKTAFGYSLYYATPLFLTGLSVAWAGRAGLFNIGAEGQMTMGGVAMAAVGIWGAKLPVGIGLTLSLVTAFVAGGVWGFIAGWMKAKRGTHEVLTTILLNFVSYGIAAFLIVEVLKGTDTQGPETALVAESFWLPFLSFIGGKSPVNAAILISVIAILIYGFVFARTRLGFHQRLAGGAPRTAEYSGVSINRQVMIAMFISGGLAALAAASPVLGFAHRAREGFAGGAGFVGIAVALLARGRPLGLLASAVLFGCLTKGALDLEFDTDYISRDLAVVIQGMIVIIIASQPGWSAWLTRVFRRAL